MRSMTLTAAAILMCLALNGWAADAKKYGSIYDVPVAPMKAVADSSTTLAQYKGKVLLIVNVASKCGLTPQYQQLEALNKKYKDQGLQIVGFPSNDFKNQEPGTEAEIMEFCKSKYDVSFPIFAKVHAKGDEKAPLYDYLTGSGATYPGDIKWNFEKFIVSRDGKVVARFEPKEKPDSKPVVEAIEKELQKK